MKKVTRALAYGLTAFALAMTGASALAQADCKPFGKLTTLTPGLLTVSTGTLPPFNSVDASGNYTGVEADVLKQFAVKYCLTIKPIIADPAGIIQYVVSGRSDLAAFGWYRTSARAKVVRIGDPLLLERMAIYSKDGSTKLSSLKGRKVGTMQGYLWVADLKALLGDSLVLYPNPVALAQDLASGRVDVGIDSYSKGVFAQKTAGGYPGLQIRVAEPEKEVKSSVEPAQTGFLVQLGNEALAEAIAKHIQELRGSGELGRILTKYGLDPSAANVGEPRMIN